LENGFFQDADEGELPVAFLIIEAVSDDEQIRDFEAPVRNRERLEDPPARAIEEGAGGSRASAPGGGAAGIRRSGRCR